MLSIRLLMCAVALSCSAVALGRDGQPDPHFGSGGLADLLRADANVYPKSMTVDAQNRIVVVGSIAGAGLRGFVLRLLPGGQPDPGFADDGWFVMPEIPALGLAPGTGTVFAAVATAPSGIYVAGYPKNSPNTTCALVVGLNDAGELRADFGTGSSGAVCGPAGLPDGESSLPIRNQPRIGLVLTQDQLLVSVVRIHGYGYAYPTAEWLHAFTLTGASDARFGNQGLLTLTGGFRAGGLALDEQGRLLVNGSDNFGFAFQRRLLPSGNLDNTFGLLGNATIAVPDFGHYAETGELWAMHGDRPTVGFRKYRDLAGVQGAWNYGFLRLTGNGSADPEVAPIPANTNTGYVSHPTLDLFEPTGWFDTAAARDRYQRVVIAGPELVRLRHDGELDLNFAAGGYVDLPQPRTQVGLAGATRFVQQSITTDAAGNIFVATAEFSSVPPLQPAFRVMKFIGDTLLTSGFE